MDLSKVSSLVWGAFLLFLTGCFNGGEPHSVASKTFSLSDTTLKAADISRDGKHTLISDNNQVCLWDNVQEKQRYCITTPDAQLIELLGFYSTGRYFYTSNRVNVHVYRVDTGRLMSVWSAGDNIINDIAVSDDERVLVFGFRTGQASVVQTFGEKVKTYSPHRLDINSVSISADGQWILSGSSDKKATLWNSQTGDIKREIKQTTRINFVALSKDAKAAFTLDAVKDRNFWRLDQQEPTAELQDMVNFIEVNQAAYSKDNKRLLTGSPKQKLQLWDTSTGERLAFWQTDGASWSMRTSVLAVNYPNANKVASITSDGIYQEWPLNLSLN